MNSVLIEYWPIIDFKAEAPPSALPSASPVQRGIASSCHDHAGSAETDGTVTPMDCKEQFETSWGGWQEPLLNGLKKRGGRRRAKGLTWYHLCTTRNRAWALLMPRTAVRLVVPWLLHCSWTLWWWEGLQEGNTGSIHTLPGGTKQWNYVRASCLMETVWATVDHSSCLLRPLFPPAPLQNTALWTFPDIQH